jgi:tetratricopeptide (TPR) repeat protein
MATVYVIHAEEDTRFVKQRVLRGLPSIGYDCWLARHHFADVRPDEHVIAQAMDQSPAILIVLSPALIKSPTSGEEVVSALAGRHTLIVVQIAALGEGDAARLPEKLWALPKVDFTVEAEDDARRLLAGLLPPVGGEPEPSPKEAERIEWNEEIFSAALANAIARHAHARAESLVATIIGHIKHRPYPYPPKHAFNDLNRLRLEREFELMCRYAEAVIASGTRQDAIRRLFAQALIETRQYDRALEILKAIINEPDSSPREVFEAQGLIGRTFKQRYVEAPNAPGAAEMIRQAITAYEAVYVQDSSQYWHGVNAASCILRAVRDGVAAAPPSRAREIAQQIVDDLDRLSLTTILEVWDCASRVEALLALGRYDEAERALDVYINHPDMNRPDWRETMAFGVRSTFRQFDQLLELGRAPRGAALLARLHEAMERYRAVNVVALSAPAMKRAGEPEGGAAVRTRPLIIRVWDPAWEPKGVTDLVIQTRFGQVITARGSDVGVRQLLEDSTVAAVEDSRPAAQIECDRSVPFIKAAAQYSSAGGPYKETGDRALIAVIDNGIDILHKAFLGADGNSRIVGIWDQTDGGGTPPKGFSYGTFHDAAAIAGYLKTGFVPFTLGRNVQGHGTHVASIAGGRAAGNFFGGVGREAAGRRVRRQRTKRLRTELHRGARLH